jgi:hypothetical protein
MQKLNYFLLYSSFKNALFLKQGSIYISSSENFGENYLFWVSQS